MKFNIAYPLTGAQKTIDIDDDKRCAIFFDKRMGQEVTVDDQLGPEFNGVTFKIMGGNDKQGFAMKQGVLVNGRARLLLRGGSTTYRQRRTGERKRKTVRGCVVGKDIRALFISITRLANKDNKQVDIAGLTDVNTPRRLGPKRANNIRKLFNLKSKSEEKKTETIVPLLKKSIIRRTFTGKNGNNKQKAVKIQRIITESRLRRKRIFKEHKISQWKATIKAADEYHKFLVEYKKKKAAKAAEAHKVEAEKKAANTKDAKKDAKKDDKKNAKKDSKKDAPKQQPAKQTKNDKKPADKKTQKK